MPKKRFTEGQIVFTLCFFGSNFEIFDPLDFLAAVTSHIPNRGEHLVRYYRSYSSVQRGQRRRQGLGKMPLGPIPLSDETACPKVARGNWARLIKKVFAVDPLVCTDCGGAMRLIAFIVHSITP